VATDTKRKRAGEACDDFQFASATGPTESAATDESADTVLRSELRALATGRPKSLVTWMWFEYLEFIAGQKAMRRYNARHLRTAQAIEYFETLFRKNEKAFLERMENAAREQAAVPDTAHGFVSVANIEFEKPQQAEQTAATQQAEQTQAVAVAA
jgi:hypothetical protein